MARYRVLATSYINDEVVQPGAIVEYDGTAEGNLELLDPSEQAGIEKALMKDLRDRLTAKEVFVPDNISLADIRTLWKDTCSRIDISEEMKWADREARDRDALAGQAPQPKAEIINGVHPAADTAVWKVAAPRARGG